MKKIEIIELLQKSFPEKYDTKLLAFEIGKAYAEILPMIKGDLITYTSPIGDNGDLRIVNRSLTLPKRVINIPLPGSGVRQLRSLGDFSINFNPVMLNAIGVFKNIEIGRTHSVPVGYAFTGGRLTFDGYVPDGTKVIADCLIAFSDFEYEDEVPWPDEFMGRIFTRIISEKFPVEDKVKDQNPKTR